MLVEGVDGRPKGAPVALRRAPVAIGVLESDGGAFAKLTVTLGPHDAADAGTLSIGQSLLRIEGPDGLHGPIGMAERAVLRRVLRRPIAVPKEEVGALLERLPGWSERAAIRADEGVLGPSLEPDHRPLVLLDFGEHLSMRWPQLKRRTHSHPRSSLHSRS